MAQLGDFLRCYKQTRKGSALTPQKAESTAEAASICVRHFIGNFLSKLYCVFLS